MVTLVETIDEFNLFFEEYIDTREAIIIPVFADSITHPFVNELILVYVKIKENEYLLCFDHNDTLSLPTDVIDDLNVSYITKYVPDKKSMIHKMDFENVTDIGLLYWFINNKQPRFDINVTLSVMPFISNGKIRAERKYIPVYQIADNCSEIADGMMKLVDQHGNVTRMNPFRRYNDKVIPVFSQIERSGLKVDKKLFNSIFKEKGERVQADSLVYTDYNLYTSTGRPSNAHNRVNYAALNNDTGEKKPFVSRFEDGKLLLFDYDAFHLRLIGTLIDYDLPGESFHTYLGRKYFGEEELTPEQYDESKKISFHLLYGEIIDEVKKIEFFSRTQDLINRIWDVYKDHNMVQTPIFRRQIVGDHIKRMNPNKALNYILQSYETEFNVNILEQLFDLLEDYKTELILYTYDSFLFDYSESDGLELIEKIQGVMDQQGMITKYYSGKSYDSLDLVEK